MNNGRKVLINKEPPPEPKKSRVYFYMGADASENLPRLLCAETNSVFVVKTGFFSSKEFKYLEQCDSEIFTTLENILKSSEQYCPCGDKNNHQAACIWGEVKKALQTKAVKDQES
jgi:hypothetical protein